MFAANVRFVCRTNVPRTGFRDEFSVRRARLDCRLLVVAPDWNVSFHSTGYFTTGCSTPGYSTPGNSVPLLQGTTPGNSAGNSVRSGNSAGNYNKILRMSDPNNNGALTLYVGESPTYFITYYTYIHLLTIRLSSVLTYL